MTSFSKFFNTSISNKSCHELLHPWTHNCNQAWFDMFRTIGPGACKLLFPFVFVSVVYNGHNNNRQQIIDSIVTYVKMIVNAIGCVLGAVWALCFFRKILGRFYPTTVVALPFAMFGPISSILSPSVRKTHSQAFFNFVLEAWIKNSKNPIIKAMRTSKIIGILLFMGFSSSIMYHLKINKFPIFWFIKPTVKKQGGDENAILNKQYVINSEYTRCIFKSNEQFVCDHANFCDRHVLDGLLTYGKYGLAIELIKRLFASVGLIRSNPLLFVRKIITSTNYNFVKFMMAYGGLYRLSNCILNRKFGEESPKTSMLAGLIAGSAFYFAPNYYFFTYGFSTMVQLMWHALGTADQKCFKHFDKLYNIPWSILIYGLFGAILVHIRLFKPRLLPKMAIKVNDMMTNGYTKGAADKIHALSLLSASIINK